MSDDQEQVGSGPVDSGHDSVAAAFDDGIDLMPGVRAAMAGPGLSGVLGGARSATDLIGQYPGLGAVKGYDFTKLAGMSTDLQSVSERVSAAAKSWMTSTGAHGALAATAAARFDGINGVLGNARAATDLIGQHPGLGAVKGYDFTKLAGSDPHGGSSGLAAVAAAALKFDDGVGRLSGVQSALNAMAGPGLSGVLGGARSATDLIGRYPGLDGVKGYDFTKLAGMSRLAGMSADLESVGERVSAAATSWMTSAGGAHGALAAAAAFKFDGIDPMPGVRAAMNAMAGPGLSGVLGADNAARFGTNWASGDLGRSASGLSGLMGVGGAMADHLSIFDKVVGDSQRAMHEAMGRWTTSAMGPASWMTEAMRGWSTLADGGHWAARLALRMALRAKRAVLRGDIDAVKRFLCDWLGFTVEFVTPDLVGSASLVLLDEPAWLPDELLALDYDPRPTLRKLTLAEHRSCTRMITDPRRRANHQPVLSLNKPITAADSDSSSTTSLLELVAAKPQPELVAANDDISNPRVLSVLAKLTDRERKIVEEQGHVGTTWAQAAEAHGATAAEGTRVRRKAKRLSKIAGGPATAPCRQRTGTERQESVAARATDT